MQLGTCRMSLEGRHAAGRAAHTRLADLPTAAPDAYTAVALWAQSSCMQTSAPPGPFCLGRVCYGPTRDRPVHVRAKREKRKGTPGGVTYGTETGLRPVLYHQKSVKVDGPEGQ